MPLADDAAAAAFLADQIAQGVTFIDRLGVGSAGVRHVYSIQLQNAASVDQSGYDAAIQYAFEAGANRFDLGLSASVIDEIVTQLAPGSTPTDVVDTYFNPLSLRMRGSLGWSLDGWRVNAAINYNGSYTDNSAAPSRPVEAWSTADFTFAYEFGRFADGSPLSGVLLTLSVVNAFDEPPPYVVGAGQQPNIHYDSGNADPYGRIASVEIRKRW
jgi:iron complex outermembrane receptor protein